ncbi:peroxisomal biogenesis factor 19-like [Watersipora subatra]|uniref:peroxisomal biogenesis factor 19-like n=1 Tax=Watersipora subatra TaxID=2589382 RepID=UPI00355C5F69
MSDSQESPTPSKVSTEAAGTCPDELDPELDALLDDSLADLSAYSTSQNETKVEQAARTSGKEGTPSVAGSEDDMLQALLGGAMSASGPAELEEHFKTLLQDDPVAMAEFEKLNATMSGPTDAASQKSFADTLAETLSSLSANAESLKDEMSDEELMKSFQESLNLGADGSKEGAGDFVPMMENMMSSLLSKDILYPSLKDLADKYPEWLSANNGKLPKNQFDKYTKQFDIVSRLCDCYKSERETDTQQVKDERFEKILDLLTEMQDCGPPPQDIVGKLAPGLNFDSSGNPQLPGMEQCSIM